MTVSYFALYCFKTSKNLHVYPWKTDRAQLKLQGLHSKIAINVSVSEIRAFTFSHNDLFYYIPRSGYLTNLLFITHNPNDIVTRNFKEHKIVDF